MTLWHFTYRSNFESLQAGLHVTLFRAGNVVCGVCDGRASEIKHAASARAANLCAALRSNLISVCIVGPEISQGKPSYHAHSAAER